MKQMKNNVLLVLTALIWGCAFVAQSVGMDYVGPFTFNAVRCLIGAAVLIPVILFMDKSARKSGLTDEEMKSRRGDTKTLVTGGICCGLALGIASSLQQWGILFTTVGKARVYYRYVYCAGSNFRYFSWKESPSAHLVLCGTGGSRSLFSLHE